MTPLERLLVRWMPRQRWFAGKGAPVDDLHIEDEHPVGSPDPGPDGPGMRALVVSVHQRGELSRYLVPIGLCRQGRLRADLAHCAIGTATLPGGVRTVYDALHDPELTARLLTAIAADQAAGQGGPGTAGGTGAAGSGSAEGAAAEQLRFRCVPGTDRIATGMRSLVHTGEQSNTTLVYGEHYVLKAFRRLWPGLNPDLELSRALAGSPYAARPHGWIETDLRGSGEDSGAGSASGAPVTTTLAMLQQYLRSATDGWVLAATSVRDLYAEPQLAPGEAGGDFAAESERLGAATAAVHRALARELPTDVLGTAELRERADAMARRLDAAVDEVPGLLPYAAALRTAYDDFARLTEPLAVQRVHGDFHLGQVVRTDRGWVLLDFEGEPAVPIAERRRPSSPLRDVAGMLRSFDYAARHQMIGSADEQWLAPVARAWARRNRAAFCAGYAAADGIDPELHRTALRAFEYDKAVYEVLYEARNRPTWLRIPLDSIAALAGAPAEQQAGPPAQLSAEESAAGVAARAGAPEPAGAPDRTRAR
ncbi:maltokinase N-terminal cap-like domain-containing protein [Nocardiopsis coralliicola]